MSATVTQFPIEATELIPCADCGQPCREDELSECNTCSEKTCGLDKHDCKGRCTCDQLALLFAARLEIMRGDN